MSSQLADFGKGHLWKSAVLDHIGSAGIGFHKNKIGEDYEQQNKIE